MRSLLFVVVLFLVCIAAVGFYRGWFQLSTDTMNPRPSATITVDKEKIHADEQKAKDEMKQFGQDAKEKFGDRNDKAEEPDADPETRLRF